MHITSLALHPPTRAQALQGVGVALAVTPDRAHAHRYLFEVVCRMPKARLGGGNLELPASVFLTAIRAVDQSPETINLVGARLVFQQDVGDEGDNWAAVLRGELDTEDGPAGPFLIHASCFEHVSNVIYVG